MNFERNEFMTQLVPITNLGMLYINGMVPSYASATTLTVSFGQCRDVNNVQDIVVDDAVTIDAAVNGLNGLDTGALANNTFYYIYAISDQTGFNPSGYILSANLLTPTLPENYSTYRRIGVAKTDGSANFLIFYVSGNNNARSHYWDTSISVLAAGTATSLTAVSLAAAVPPIDLTPVMLQVAFIPNTASDKVSFAPFGSTATVLPNISGVVASQTQTGQLKVMSKLDSGVPKILYINSAATGSSSVTVSGFDYYV